jgi:hypothetical protein
MTGGCDAHIRVNDWALSIFFFHWEIEAGNLSAALNRLRSTDWKGSEPVMAIQLARAYIIAGRQVEIPDLLSEVNARFRYAAEFGFLADAAMIRKLAARGDTTSALATALGQPDLPSRVKALTVVAEALAGIPGLPDEKLRPFAIK